MKTIVFVNPWQGINGPNVGMLQLAGESLRRGIAVHIVTKSHDEFAEQMKALGAAVYVYPGMELTPRSRNPLALARHFIVSWRFFNKVSSLAERVSASVICINSENMLLAGRAGRLANCHVVAIMRGLRFETLGKGANVFFALQQRWINHYIAVAELGSKLLSNKGVPSEKIRVIRNGVDMKQYSPGPRDEELAAELQINSDEVVIGTIGVLTPRKGVHHLIEVIGRLASTMPNVKCVIVGSTSLPADEVYECDLRQQIRRLGLQQRVIMTGYRSDIPRFLRLFTLLVHPSETENCPRSILETQACQVPVVGFRVGGMPEVIEDGQTGILIEPFDTNAMADTVARLLADRSERIRLGQNGRRRVERLYNLEVNLAIMVDLLVSLSKNE